MPDDTQQQQDYQKKVEANQIAYKYFQREMQGKSVPIQYETPLVQRYFSLYKRGQSDILRSEVQKAQQEQLDSLNGSQNVRIIQKAYQPSPTDIVVKGGKVAGDVNSVYLRPGTVYNASYNTSKTMSPIAQSVREAPAPQAIQVSQQLPISQRQQLSGRQFQELTRPKETPFTQFFPNNQISLYIPKTGTAATMSLQAVSTPQPTPFTPYFKQSSSQEFQNIISPPKTAFTPYFQQQSSPPAQPLTIRPSTQSMSVQALSAAPTNVLTQDFAKYQAFNLPYYNYPTSDINLVSKLTFGSSSMFNMMEGVYNIGATLGFKNFKKNAYSDLLFNLPDYVRGTQERKDAYVAYAQARTVIQEQQKLSLAPESYIGKEGVITTTTSQGTSVQLTPEYFQKNYPLKGFEAEANQQYFKLPLYEKAQTYSKDIQMSTYQQIAGFNRGVANMAVGFYTQGIDVVPKSGIEKARTAPYTNVIAAGALYAPFLLVGGSSFLQASKQQGFIKTASETASSLSSIQFSTGPYIPKNIKLTGIDDNSFTKVREITGGQYARSNFKSNELIALDEVQGRVDLKGTQISQTLKGNRFKSVTKIEGTVPGAYYSGYDITFRPVQVSSVSKISGTYGIIDNSFKTAFGKGEEIIFSPTNIKSNWGISRFRVDTVDLYSGQTVVTENAFGIRRNLGNKFQYATGTYENQGSSFKFEFTSKGYGTSDPGKLLTSEKAFIKSVPYGPSPRTPTKTFDVIEAAKYFNVFPGGKAAQVSLTPQLFGGGGSAARSVVTEFPMSTGGQGLSVKDLASFANVGLSSSLSAAQKGVGSGFGGFFIGVPVIGTRAGDIWRPSASTLIVGPKEPSLKELTGAITPTSSGTTTITRSDTSSRHNSRIGLISGQFPTQFQFPNIGQVQQPVQREDTRQRTPTKQISDLIGPVSFADFGYGAKFTPFDFKFPALGIPKSLGGERGYGFSTRRTGRKSIKPSFTATALDLRGTLPSSTYVGGYNIGILPSQLRFIPSKMDLGFGSPRKKSSRKKRK